MVAHPVAELVTPDWAEALTGVEPRIHEMGDFLRAETAAGRGFYLMVTVFYVLSPVRWLMFAYLSSVRTPTRRPGIRWV